MPGGAAADDAAAGPRRRGPCTRSSRWLSLPRWCGRGCKVDHAALAICSQWTSPLGVALPHFAWIRRRALAFGGWRAEPHRTEHEQALSYAGLQRRADHA